MRRAWLNIGLSAQAPSTRQSGMTMKHTPFLKFPLPNFFMIGAAKSGTTALWHALRQHPDIHLSPIKEPCFFLSNGHAPNHTGHGWDFVRSVGVWRPGDYVKLFGESRMCHAVGEASPLSEQSGRRLAYPCQFARQPHYCSAPAACRTGLLPL